jgi:hypothetical protein
MKFDFVANLKNGKLSDSFMDNISRYLLTLKDGPVQVIIQKYRAKRTDQQNRYYWAVVVRTIGHHCGYTDEETHDALRWLFLRQQADGKPNTVKSTTKLNTQEFENYINEIKRWAAMELQLYIPDPNELTGQD